MRYTGLFIGLSLTAVSMGFGAVAYAVTETGSMVSAGFLTVANAVMGITALMYSAGLISPPEPEDQEEQVES